MGGSAPALFVELRCVLRAGLAAGMLWFSGCALTVPAGSPSTPSDQSPEATAPVTLQEPPPNAVVQARPQIVVLIGEEFGEYRDLSYVFSARLARPYRLFELAGRELSEVRADLAALQPASVIALGDSALALAADLKAVDVVYAGVLMPGSGHRGVDALPPFALQLEYWRQMNPLLGRIGVIGSVDSRAQIEAIAQACAAAGVELETSEVTSDRQMLLSFRAMVPRLDGFVLLPDPQILSPDVIRRVISHGDRNELQLLVYSPLMYELGASLFVESDPVDVAVQIIALLNSSDTAKPLTKMKTQSRGMWQRMAADG